MRLSKIDGNSFEQMLHYAVAYLKAEEKELNSLNVFPVADGDTGTNMRSTLENALHATHSDARLGTYLKSLSNSMLLSARGNSGVILSQLFKGFSLELARNSMMTTSDFRNALIRAHKVAYAAVINPVEGTMLTVAREGIERIKHLITTGMLPEQMLELYLAEMEHVLQETPDMLPVLKEAGVVDSGGMGYITIFRGLQAYLLGQPMPEGGFASEAPASRIPQPNLDLFTEDSRFEDGYCMEFILQRMKDRAYRQQFSRDDFVSRLSRLGESLVVVESGMRVKVHVHTKCPAEIIGIAQMYGEFLTFKLENMQVQHNEFDSAAAAKTTPTQENVTSRAFAIVAVADGEGFRKVYGEQGCTCVLDGGSTMSVSASEFLSVFESLRAAEIAVLTNSANVVFAAEQARDLYAHPAAIHVIPTVSLAEGYFALAMDIPDEPSAQKRLKLLEDGARNIRTVSFARSTKDFSHNGTAYKKDAIVAFVNGEPVASGGDVGVILADLLESCPELKECDTCVAFRGLKATDGEAASLQEAIEAAMPLADLTVIDAGQIVYSWMIGLI